MGLDELLSATETISRYLISLGHHELWFSSIYKEIRTSETFCTS